MTPVDSVGTTGRGLLLFVSVVRYAVVDTVRIRLPVGGELLFQGWSLLKVTALPALLMAIPFGGAMVAVVTSGLVNQVGASSLVGAAGGVGIVRQGGADHCRAVDGGAPQRPQLLRISGGRGRSVKNSTPCG